MARDVSVIIGEAAKRHKLTFKMIFFSGRSKLFGETDSANASFQPRVIVTAAYALAARER